MNHETEVPRHACAALRRGACDGQRFTPALGGAGFEVGAGFDTRVDDDLALALYSCVKLKPRPPGPGAP